MLAVTATNADAVTRIPHRCTAGQTPPVLCAIHHHHKAANRYRERMGLRPIPYHWIADRRTTSPVRRERILTYWYHVHQKAAARYKRWVASPMAWYYSSGAQCVHGREGSWTDAGAPYWGGFQMNMAFQQAHGARYLAEYGTADHWPIIDQIRVTENVVKASGWGQWPNTARACGLL